MKVVTGVLSPEDDGTSGTGVAVTEDLAGAPVAFDCRRRRHRACAGAGDAGHDAIEREVRDRRELRGREQVAAHHVATRQRGRGATETAADEAVPPRMYGEGRRDRVGASSKR